MGDEHPCAGAVWPSGAFHSHPCSRRGLVEENGRWWCKQHSPSSEAARRAGREAKWDAKAARRAKADALAERLSVELGVKVAAQVDNDREPTGRVVIDAADLEAIAQQLKNEFG